MKDEQLNISSSEINADGDSRQIDLLVSRQPKRDLFGIVPIKSISFNQDEIIESILQLHSINGKIDIDPTYSVGNFYKGGIQKPEHKFDIEPQCEGVLPADARQLPLEDESVYTLMFDPPFLVDKGDYSDSKIKSRFSVFPTYRDLWKFYTEALKEFYRILKPKGIVIFKCGDYEYCRASWLLSERFIYILGKKQNVSRKGFGWAAARPEVSFILLGV